MGFPPTRWCVRAYHMSTCMHGDRHPDRRVDSAATPPLARSRSRSRASTDIRSSICVCIGTRAHAHAANQSAPRTGGGIACARTCRAPAASPRRVSRRRARHRAVRVAARHVRCRRPDPAAESPPIRRTARPRRPSPSAQAAEDIHTQTQATLPICSSISSQRTSG